MMAPGTTTMAGADIVDTAVEAGSFTTLVAAVQAAGLEETLRGEGPFTVFAPTDEAFAALPAGTVDALLADPTGDLTAILTYHVVDGEVMAADVAAMDGQEVTTVNGATFTVNVGRRRQRHADRRCRQRGRRGADRRRRQQRRDPRHRRGPAARLSPRIGIPCRMRTVQRSSSSSEPHQPVLRRPAAMPLTVSRRARCELRIVRRRSRRRASSSICRWWSGAR